MSRSGYVDDMDDQWAFIRYRGAVTSALRGARGQAFLRELRDLMDAMPEKILVAHELEADGNYCALGVVGLARGLDMSKIDPEDAGAVSKMFDIAECLAREIVFENDEYVDENKRVRVEICGPVRKRWPDFGQRHYDVMVPDETAARRRWEHMRKWVEEHIIKEPNQQVTQ